MAVVASLGLPVSGCTVGPDFVAPPPPLADNFVGAKTKSIQIDHQDYRDWWRAFRDPTLNQLVQIAYDQNISLMSAGTRVLQARAVLGIAIANYIPRCSKAPAA